MRARTSSGLRLGLLTSFFLSTVCCTVRLHASNLEDTAHQLAQKIVIAAGSGTFALDVTNHSSLDEKSVLEIRSTLEAAFQAEHLLPTQPEKASGTIHVVLGESLRNYVWIAEILIGSDQNGPNNQNNTIERKFALISLPRSPSDAPFAPALPIVLRTTLLFAQEQPILDVAIVEIAGSPRLLALSSNQVLVYHPAATSSPRRWELETSVPVAHGRAFPRDLRGRIFLRHDHLFDIYMPGVFCRSISDGASQITLACNDSDDPWPLSPDDSGPRAFFAISRNFFTGVLSPGIGRISNLPSFYSATEVPRPGSAVWAVSTLDGSLHLVNGFTDRAVPGENFGSELAAVHSSCGTRTQLLVSKPGDAGRDGLRAFEIPDREPVAVSSAVEFEGEIVALRPENGGNGASAIVRRKDTGWYEAYRVSVSCEN